MALIESLDNKIDTSTPMGMLIFNTCAVFSGMELELIRERVQAGIDAAKLNSELVVGHAH
ncbi:TPA: hypothetical protein JBD08_05550 [Legionella pneumophila subsp. pneumophila]|uniref:recombinase family protein n=1 Tax=Legionella pneumophila TaxID=446 RepID=UPI0007707B40|nr:recombinase family protein [Legionella pneumophila]HAT9119663.1 hypothetical protein [Legionella pneumophila subsp. pneumophila]CZG56508.1 Resolvase%2C N terminal domain [Legionella pneumophila]CZH34459.1 Resolvase%2C N terminal domain [Legionella pneumophila]CZH80045.1 Resolvase%2C N terminal domain [Legionella pneumophila]CZJ68457.1 Resolvase%2C N terminal domain [Legionella pneumophila]